MSRRLAGALAILALAAFAAPARAVCPVTSACSATPFLTNAACCGATSCTLDGVHGVSGAACTFDFEGRNVVISNKLVVGSNALTLYAKSLRVTGQIDARGTNPNPGGDVTIILAGGAALPFSLDGSSGARLDASGYGRGGSLAIQADGPVRFISGGSVLADGIDTSADGGVIVVDAAGTVTVGEPLSAQGSTGGLGGSVDVLVAAHPTAGAGDLVLTSVGKILVNGGAGDGGSLSIAADGAVTLPTASLLQANALGTSAGFGGSIDVVAGTILAQGFIQAHGGGDATGDFGGDGGAVALEARTGPLTVQRTTTVGIDADGASGGGDGEVTLETDSPVAGDLLVDAAITVQGAGDSTAKPAGGGTVSISSAGALGVTKSINVNGTGLATGFIELSAQRTITIAPTSGTITGTDPGGGGFLTVEAGTDVVIDGNLQLQAALSQGGIGGDVFVSAARDLTVKGGRLVDVSGKTTGSGGFIGMDAGRNLVVSGAAELRTNGGSTSGAPAGMIVLNAGVPDTTGNVTIHGNLTAAGHSADPDRHALIQMTGCSVLVSGTGNVDSRGDTASTNVLSGRTDVRVASGGKLRATGRNLAIYANGAPVTTGATVSPALQLEVHPVCTTKNPFLPAGCLVPCPLCGNGHVDAPWEDCEPGDNGCVTHCDDLCRTRICDDGNPCTSDDGCDPALGCLFTPVPDGSSCDDATVCNGREVCLAGSCLPGAGLLCGDGNPCTTDACNAQSGCQHTSITGAGQGDCNDLCIEMCTSGTCVTKTPPDCNDNDPKTNDFCDPATGQCVHPSGPPCTSNAMCNDGNRCTADTCIGGFCQFTPVANGTPCPDSNVCNGAETCSNGSCASGTPLACNDNEPCTVDSCDSVLGCRHADIPGCCTSVADCGGNPQCLTCTANQCRTIADCCLVAADCDDGEPCTTDGCNQATHTCTHAALPDATACGDVCAPGTCQAGACQTTPLVCPDDGSPCTLDFCDPQAGCVHVPDPECCLDAGAPCDDHDVCTVDACDTTLSRCTHAQRDGGCAPCDADTDCDPLGPCAGRICDPGGFCRSQPPVDCSDGTANTFDACELDGAGAPVCRHTCLNDAGCSGGSFCDGAPVCSAGACVPGAPPACDDADACTDDACPAGAAACTHTPKTEFPGVTCRLDTITGVLAGAGALDIPAKLQAKVGRLLGLARRNLDAAHAAGPGKKALKKLKAARKQMAAIARAVQNAQRHGKIASALAQAILAAAQDGVAAVDALRPLLTP